MAGSRDGVLHRIQRVMRAFLPEEQDFFVLFASAADKAVEAAECLDKLMDDYGRLDLAVEQIDDIENEGDEIVHETVQKLNTTFVTPILFDREDIYRLAECLDDIPDMIKGTIGRFSSFRITGPDQHAREMSQLLLEATKLLKENIYQLPRMQAGDTHYCRQINTLENQGDAALKKALGDLFDQQPDACEIIKWKEVYEFIEEAMDRCEDAANLIEAVVTKNA